MPNIVRWCVVTLLLCCGSITFLPVASAQSTQVQATPQPTAVAKNDYSNGDNWLCRPRRQDACAVDLSTTIITADGKLTPEPWAARRLAPMDCFYVYPTVSVEHSGNSDMVIGPGEKRVASVQFARFASKCRVYAPMYRQVTLTALRAAIVGISLPADRAMAYNDVADAWNYYLEHDNQGRGVVLIGHSQGANILMQLIKREIDGKPVQNRVISALLLGANVPVPKGKDVGGVFQHMPLCHAADQFGCVITYVSFRATAPPPDKGRFGKVDMPDAVAGCTNPAALAGGSGELHAYLLTHGYYESTSQAEGGAWLKSGQPITTPFVSVPGLLTAECVSNEHGSYLAVTVHPDPAGQRANDIVGDVMYDDQVLPEWGLHLIDVNLAMGNLLSIVEQQGEAYRAAQVKKWLASQ